MAALAFGEGWHNYHHAFPWDYKAAELGNYRLNMSTALIDFCAKLGLAYDLKVASPELVKRRALRTGDGTHPGSAEKQEEEDGHHHSHENAVWGWDDENMSPDELKLVNILNRSKQE